MSNYSGGISIIKFIGVLFVGLKLTGYITWSWFWVLTPFWIPLIIGIFAMLIYLRIIIYKH